MGRIPGFLDGKKRHEFILARLAVGPPEERAEEQGLGPIEQHAHAVGCSQQPTFGIQMPGMGNHLRRDRSCPGAQPPMYAQQGRFQFLGIHGFDEIGIGTVAQAGNALRPVHITMPERT